MELPPNATVVGVPGHVVMQKDSPEKNEQREAMAKKIGFDAYAESKDMPDPIQNALNSILDHMHKVDSELENIKKKNKD